MLYHELYRQAIEKCPSCNPGPQIDLFAACPGGTASPVDDRKRCTLPHVSFLIFCADVPTPAKNIDTIEYLWDCNHEYFASSETPSSSSAKFLILLNCRNFESVF